LKSHLLFDWEIPRFNQLARMFGNMRCGPKQKKIVEEFLFSNSTWIVDTIDEMLRSWTAKAIPQLMEA